MIKSEWIKLWSVRSSWWSLYVAAAGMIGIAVTYSLVIKPVQATPTDALQGAAFGQLAFGVLGVLAVSTEYSTGLIRTTFATVPRRRRVIAAKAALLVAVLLAAAQIVAFAAFFTAQLLLGHRGVHFSLGDRDMLISVLGCGCYMTFIGMFGFCVGVLLQKTTPAIATFFGIVFVAMGVIPNLMPDSIKADVTRLTFLKIGEAMSNPARTLPRDATDGLLSTGAAWGMCLVYLAVVVVVPLLVVTRRDTD
ncbi:MAG: ABC transporter permease subunit [Catenulispora sp.]|nr:ABC transporter permease subunit [Catenulispora sp.]